MSEHTLDRYHLFQYAFLAMPLAFAGLPMYIHAPDFYTRNLGLNLTIMGAILLLIRLFDAIQDPLIGRLSDHYQDKRSTIILSGMIALSLGLLALFWGPQSSISMPLWFSGSLILATTGFSVVTINLNMIGGFWSHNKNDRTTISAWREGFSLLGLLVASLLPAILMLQYSASDSFKILFVTFTCITLFAIIFFSKFLRNVSLEHLNAKNTQGNVKAFRALFLNNIVFFRLYFISQIASALPAVLLLFFVRDYLRLDNYTGLFLLLYFLSGTLLMAIWVNLSKKYGKYETWLISMILSVFVFVWVVFLQPGDLLSYAIICILSGFALGADLSLPPSIIADRITQQKNQAQATFTYGVMAFIPKLALAIASGGGLLILGLSGFKAGAVNPPHTLYALVFLYGLLPCIIKFISAYMLYRLIKQNKKGDNNETHMERSSSYGTSNVS